MSSELLNRISKEQHPGVFVYKAKETHADIQFVESSEKCAIVVNSLGQLVGLDFITNIDQIVSLIEDPDAYDRGLSEEYVAFLKDLPNSKVLKEVQSSLHSLSKPPEVTLSYIASYAIQNPKKVLAQEPTLTTTIREVDRHLLDPLIRLIEGAGPLIRDCFKLTKLPEGDSCADCKVKL